MKWRSHTVVEIPVESAAAGHRRATAAGRPAGSSLTVALVAPVNLSGHRPIPTRPVIYHIDLYFCTRRANLADGEPTEHLRAWLRCCRYAL